MGKGGEFCSLFVEFCGVSWSVCRRSSRVLCRSCFPRPSALSRSGVGFNTGLVAEFRAVRVGLVVSFAVLGRSSVEVDVVVCLRSWLSPGNARSAESRRGAIGMSS